ncbi:unnamed protein product [Effrenium voratum]|uniref:WW domain-containing protein n=1 Tax=Effrenium voratum TaxID=2562239 RepID=A0AA36MUP9_9DINO|nr:unnamed protein product [Effrenium voratum]
MTVAKLVSDFTRELADIVEERCSLIQTFVDEGRAASRDELAKFVFGTAKRIYKQIQPDLESSRKQAWLEAKGMLKDIVDFDVFTPTAFFDPCVKNVLEAKVAEVLRNYHHFILTGVVRTKHLPPKLLGETDEILCVDKPVDFTCGYGANANALLPQVIGAKTATQLLNAAEAAIQIHEYLALKFNYETAVGTREFWKEVEQKKLTMQPCLCGLCEVCACMQAGCCNRLDKETSGVMVAAKTKKGFEEIRKQFQSDHSLDEGGTEKYYFGLARGKVNLPKQQVKQSDDWIHECSGPPSQRRGRVEIALFYDPVTSRSVAWDDGKDYDSMGKNEKGGSKGKGKGQKAGKGRITLLRRVHVDPGGVLDSEDGRPQQGENGRQSAVTLYDPIAWFSDKNNDQYTLLHLQIVTGRRHQIRFHCEQIGHPLLGDCLYGAPQSDRDWAKRVFLHSYQTKFREPFTQRWFEAVSPLPQDLGNVLSDLTLERVKEGCPLFLSRRQHSKLHKVFKQYDATTKLLRTHAAPKNAQAIMPAAQANGSMNHNGHSVGYKGGSKGNGNSSAGWKDWRWDSSDSWNNWKSDGGSWNAWSSSANANAASANAASAGAPSGGNDDSDDETWGKWTPKDTKKPAETPEPEAKRPRVAVPEPADVAGQVPRTPPELPEPQVQRSQWRRVESTREAGIFYYVNTVTGEKQVEPPPPWERKQSRRDASISYYWNTVTGETSLVKPEV